MRLICIWINILLLTLQIHVDELIIDFDKKKFTYLFSSGQKQFLALP
jgi:hypothetical protein